MRCAGIPAYDVQRANFHKKWKWWIYNIFCNFMYIWWLLKCLEVFFCGKLTKPCRLARTFQLVSQQSLASINNKISTLLTKRLPVVTTVPSGTQRHHWGIGILGVYLRILYPGLSNPTTFLGSAFPATTSSLYSLQWAFPPSTLQKRRLHSLFMIVFWEYGQKRSVIWPKLALWTSN